MSKDPSQERLLDKLHRRQEKHRARAEKLAEEEARLVRRRAKLSALEESIAKLEARLAEPRKRHLGEGASSDGPLRPALLLFNPTCGRNSENNALRLSLVVASLRAHGIEAEVGLKTSGRAARKQARDAVEAGCPLVIVAGGDGTLQDVASQLVGSSTVMGIVPTGTMNNIARSLGIPLEIEDACALIGMGMTRQLDVGSISGEDRPQVRYFLDCAGVGLLAVAALTGQSFEKKRWNPFARGVRQLLQAQPQTMRVEIDDQVLDPTTHLVTVSNAPLMGNNLLAAPDAKMDDGLLDVSVYDGMGAPALSRHFLVAASGGTDDVVKYQAARVRITTVEPVPTNSDMALPGPRTVIEFSVVPKALSVIVGDGIALTTPVQGAPAAPAYAKSPPPLTELPRAENE
jgi:diacylglycerol kinase (ATP)